jgi:hypothetical protein
MPEIDLLASAVEALGEPEHAAKIGPEEAARWAGRVPQALTRFWIDHGRGAFQGGKFWICDPAPFQPVLEEIFQGDRELAAADMTTVGYTAFGTLKVWHRARRGVRVDFASSHVFIPTEASWHDRQTGKPFAEDYSIGAVLTDFRYSPLLVDEEGEDMLPQAIARLGPLAPGEIYGFAPALQLGGALAVENLHRVRAPEHLMILAQLGTFQLVRLTPPDPPANPFGRTEVVRPIGRRR